MADADKVEVGGDGEAGDGELLDGMAVLDFDLLCTSVALQTQGYTAGKRGETGDYDEESGGDFGGVQRMWEGEVLDCFDDRRIAIETMCCPCYRFGKNMGRAGLGSCFVQGTMYLGFAVIAVLNVVFFILTKRHSFLYLAIAFTISLAAYLGLFRTQIRKQFNIRANDSSLDDCLYHLLCPCCTLCQESRTLEINNVRDGFWSGRGDTICIGSYREGNKSFLELHPPHSFTTTTKTPDLSCMEKGGSGANHSWNDTNQIEPLVPSTNSTSHGS
ncbi:hypothetical protein H6P81_005714 [Aristolochia fimbriata]|uniref:Uncharacterized protein n=1 Tax=Aristolochia fimbriata TaxID=158543 RepID=A0AAV7EV88_ARIFI|nr:hypothetical protein H6P81_005714 [Aristolochia fimbriata]